MIKLKSAVQAAALFAGLSAATTGVTAQEFLTFGASGTGGTYGLIAAAMSQMISNEVEDVHINVEATPGGGRGNIRMLAQGQLDLGLASGPDATAAWFGDDSEGGAPAKNIRTLLVGMVFPFHLVVPADAGVTSPADLQGKSIVTNSAANEETFVPDALAAHGLERDSDYSLVQYSTTEGLEAFKDGRVDAFVSFVSSPNASFRELATSMDVEFIGVEPGKIDEMMSEHPGNYVSTEIAAGTYEGQEETLQTPGISVAIYTHENLSEETAYLITKTIVENSATLGESYVPAGTFGLERQKQAATSDVVPPYHAGAMRYLEEAGL